MKRKKIDNDPVLVFIITGSLPRKQGLNCHLRPLQLGSSFISLLYDILISGTETQGYKLDMKLCF